MDAFAVLAATWPPAEAMRLGPWTLRRGAGGGSRVSAATLEGEDGAIESAAAAMLAWGQAPLFMIRDGDTLYVTEAPYVQWYKTIAALTGSLNSANTLATAAGQ